MTRGEMGEPAVGIDEAGTGVEPAGSILREEVREVVEEGLAGGLGGVTGPGQGHPIDRLKNGDIGEIFGGYPAVRGAGLLIGGVWSRYHRGGSSFWTPIRVAAQGVLFHASGSSPGEGGKRANPSLRSVRVGWQAGSAGKPPLATPPVPGHVRSFGKETPGGRCDLNSCRMRSHDSMTAFHDLSDHQRARRGGLMDRGADGAVGSSRSGSVSGWLHGRFQPPPVPRLDLPRMTMLIGRVSL